MSEEIKTEEDLKRYVAWAMDQVGDSPANPTPGILWPWMPESDDSLPWVERDDESDLYDTDEEAARALVKIIGGRVMYAAVEHDDEEEPDAKDRLRPFVFAFEDSSQEPPALNRTEGGFVAGSMWEKWQAERKERFGPRRARYDEANGIKQEQAR